MGVRELECHTPVAGWVLLDGEIIAREALVRYMPKHAKPGALRDLGTASHARATTAVPSVGRHAAPEKDAADQRTAGEPCQARQRAA
jgi:hypothetical protein